jgi:N-succinyldiaminopimelate aminotransferase
MVASATAARLQPFGTSIFTEMTVLANAHGAINLSQGFPDFDGPASILEAAARAMQAGHNQYARSMGHPLLVEAIAAQQRALYGLEWDPLSEITVCCGATEGIAASLLGLLNTGDEVILFEPYYDSYPACVALAGGAARFCTLRFPDFALDSEALAALFGPRTRVLVLNTPHNPTGKVFTVAELDEIARLCQRHDVVVLADEVYEHLTFDDARHVPMATRPGMRERTLTLSSTGKTFSLTGWKIGWATGPAHLVAATQAAHQFLTFCAATPLQVAMAVALGALGDGYLEAFRTAYAGRRTRLLEVLRAAGFDVAPPDGTYFILADFHRLSGADDRTFAEQLICEHGVAAIPASAFYTAMPAEGRRLLRFAFCKRLETLEAAAERLAGLAA